MPTPIKGVTDFDIVVGTLETIRSQVSCKLSDGWTLAGETLVTPPERSSLPYTYHVPVIRTTPAANGDVAAKADVTPLSSLKRATVIALRRATRDGKESALVIVLAPGTFHRKLGTIRARNDDGTWQVWLIGDASPMHAAAHFRANELSLVELG